MEPERSFPLSSGAVAGGNGTVALQCIRARQAPAGVYLYFIKAVCCAAVATV